MIKVGQNVRFDPSFYFNGYGVESLRGYVTGTVVMVNKDHRWFSVQYENLRTSYKFDQIGKEVKIL